MLAKKKKKKLFNNIIRDQTQCKTNMGPQIAGSDVFTETINQSNMAKH
jgi:hypothetical protein